MDRAGMIREKIETINAAIEKDSTTQIGLMTGLSGLAFYYYTLFDVFEEEQYAERAVEKLEQVFELLNKSKVQMVHHSFCTGLAGFGYAANFFSRQQLTDIDMSGDFAEIDKLLCNAALREIQDIQLTDWMHGGTGVLKYFLQRTDESVIANYCHAIVNALLNSAVREETGSWFPNEFSKRDGKKEINLSLSHGQCGLLLILCDYAEKFPDQQNTRQIIHSGVEFLTRHQKVTSSEQNDDCCFPFIIDFRDRNDTKYSQRMAWCYGDLNETLLLYRAGLLMENKDWLQLAKQIGYACADRRNYEQTLAADSHFCHGASGLAAFYKHLYSISGDNTYLDASAFWINETLWLVEKDLANGNFESKEMSLIDGYAGIGAVLASSLAERKHAWMDMFLI